MFYFLPRGRGAWGWSTNTWKSAARLPKQSWRNQTKPLCGRLNWCRENHGQCTAPQTSIIVHFQSRKIWASQMAFQCTLPGTANTPKTSNRRKTNHPSRWKPELCLRPVGSQTSRNETAWCTLKRRRRHNPDQLPCSDYKWLIPEKIHTPTTEGMLENLTGGGLTALEIQTWGGLWT